jgi:hypothetical protein
LRLSSPWKNESEIYAGKLLRDDWSFYFLTKRKIFYFCNMSKVTKITALFFAAILLFLSQSAETYGLFLTSQLQNAETNNSASYLSAYNPDLVFLIRHEESSVNSVKNRPVSNLRNHLNEFYSNDIPPDLSLLCRNSGYLSYSGSVYLNLSKSDIVFPFHSFW